MVAGKVMTTITVHSALSTSYHARLLGLLNFKKQIVNIVISNIVKIKPMLLNHQFAFICLKILSKYFKY
jgi:hypothetical protein